MNENYDSLKADVMRLAEKITIPLRRELIKRGFPWEGYGKPWDYEHYYVRIDENGYHWIKCDRSDEFTEGLYTDRNEILYQICKRIVRDAVWDYSSKNKRKRESGRHASWRFTRRELNNIHPGWGDRFWQQMMEFIRDSPLTPDEIGEEGAGGEDATSEAVSPIASAIKSLKEPKPRK